MRDFAIGCDIGGSHITCAAIDLQRQCIAPRTLLHRAVDSQAPADRILSHWAAALKGALDAVDPVRLVGIGVGMPGPFDYEKGIALFSPQVAKYQSLHGLSIWERLISLLEMAPGTTIRSMNDVACFAVGEAWVGKASGLTRAVCLTLGTGFGSAFVEDGAPVVDGSHVPRSGCLWHLPFRDGIAEDFLSSRWFLREYAARSGKTAAGVKEIAEKSSIEPAARAVFQEFGENLGAFVAPWLRKFGAEAVVVGGGICHAYQLFGTSFQDTLAALGLRLPVHLSGLMEQATLLGSARLLENEFWRKVKPRLAHM
jgi:glucokinase